MPSVNVLQGNNKQLGETETSTEDGTGGKGIPQRAAFQSCYGGMVC